MHIELLAQLHCINLRVNISLEKALRQNRTMCVLENSSLESKLCVQLNLESCLKFQPRPNENVKICQEPHTSSTDPSGRLQEPLPTHLDTFLKN